MYNNANTEYDYVVSPSSKVAARNPVVVKEIPFGSLNVSNQATVGTEQNIAYNAMMNTENGCVSLDGETTVSVQSPVQQSSHPIATEPITTHKNISYEGMIIGHDNR